MAKPSVSDRLDKLSDKWLEDARVVKPSSVPAEVYHYTDAAGLVGMLSAHEIWLTDFRFLNDRSEFVYAKTIVQNVTDEVCGQDASEICQQFIDRIRHYQSTEDAYAAFVFSLSDRNDDLSQWRGYARDGLGFNIGFDAKALYRVSSPSDEQPYSFSIVEYGKARQFNTLQTAFDEFRTLLTKEDVTDEDIDTAGRLFEWMARNRGALNKHESFEGEREWRIVAYCPRDSDSINVRASGLRLVPYMKLKPQETGDLLPIRSIGVGPGFTDAEIGDAVRTLAHRNGYADLRIDFAKTPFRRL